MQLYNKILKHPQLFGSDLIAISFSPDMQEKNHRLEKKQIQAE